MSPCVNVTQIRKLISIVWQRNNISIRVHTNLSPIKKSLLFSFVTEFNLELYEILFSIWKLFICARDSSLTNFF